MLATSRSLAGAKLTTALIVIMSFRFPEAAGADAKVSRISGIQLKLGPVLSERFCSGDDDVYTQLPLFAASYANSGHEPLVLSIGTEIPSAMVVAKSAEDLKKHPIEVVHWTVYPPTDRESKAAERVVVLKPGDRVESKAEPALAIRRVVSKIPGTVTPGKYVLRVQMLIKIARKPKNIGAETGLTPNNWEWETVWSAPTDIDLPNAPNVRDCDAAR